MSKAVGRDRVGTGACRGVYYFFICSQRKTNVKKSCVGFDKLFLIKSVFTACILYFRFEANFGQQTVAVVFKCMGLPEVQPGQIRVLRKANKMEILV